MSKNDKNKTQEQTLPSEETVTITPTMIDESEFREEKKVDLSAIIPKFEDLSGEQNTIELNSRENTLKSDGSVLLALVDGDGQVRLTGVTALPEQIDIEERKKEQLKKKSGRKKPEKVKVNKSAMKRFQSRMAMVSLVIILFLGGFYYWYKNHPTDEDFVPLNVTVEVGSSLPLKKSSYIKPGVGKTIKDELQYSLDLSNVVLEVPGDYPYEVTYQKETINFFSTSKTSYVKQIKKTGTISIVDTTPPELEIRNVNIVEGTSYDASNFVENCRDNSGCNYSFQDSDTTKKYVTSGVYVVYVVATDAYGNSTTKRANLVIEAKGDVVTYLRNTNFDFTSGYETTESYELHFNSEVLINGTHQIIYHYQSDEKYNEASKTYSGEVNYTLDDSQKTITFKETVSTVGSNYSNVTYIDEYLKREGFSKIE